MRVDSHNHFWKYDATRDAWITSDMAVIQRDFFPDDLLPLLNENGIDATVTVQADQSENETQFLAGLAEKHDFIRGVVGWVDLRSTELESRLEHFSQFKKIRGFRHVVQGESPGFLLDPAFIRGVSALSRYGFTYDLLIYHYQLPEAIEFVRQLPGARIVLDHIAKPSIRTGEIKKWSEDIVTLAQYPNVWCKVSGMVTEANWKTWSYADLRPYIEVVMEAFGAKRVMYGSDWPVCLVAASYDQQFSVVNDFVASLSNDEQDAILGKNAVDFYSL